MICERCKKKIKEKAQAETRCRLCGRTITYCQTPAPTLCPECSDEFGFCMICNGSLWVQTTFDDLIGGLR